ncbi:MAG: hypothetical protein K9N47_20985 [Prosthecobacter sp.]|uniref:hypothetical protein n=1 Tax=Prosthecobacter sp. TaxID=1965333 RepID=UPI002636AF2F|nr:hypothetical protein [Prosthecobacter sp.]MCF7788611.1 hypothetical protein [Prosthecobacter sp.]
MTVTLDDFEIANGDDRTLQVVSEETLDMQQQAQESAPFRGAWARGFPERAQRSFSLSYKVTFPPCESLEDALMQSRMIPVQCPKGGVLIEYHAGVRITYAQAWIQGVVRSQRLGVTNIFFFPLEAVNPTAEELVLDGTDGEIFTDAEDGEEFTY